MKKNNKLATILLASSLLLPGIAPIASGVASVSAAPSTSVAAENTEYKVVTEEVIRFRTEENAKPVALVGRGDTVKFLEEVNLKWFKVEFEGKTGYILRGNLTSKDNFENGNKEIHDVAAPKEDSAESTYKVAVKTALRTADADRYKPLEILDRGTSVEYLGTTANNWFRVKADGVEGYVKREDVTKNENYDADKEADLSYETFRQEANPALDVLEASLTTALRSRPGTQYSPIDEVARGTKVTYKGTVKGLEQWFLVELEDGRQGYINRSHVTKVVEEVEEDLKVESVSAINAKQVKVTFNNALPTDVDFSNFEVDGDKVVTEAKVNGKVATLTVNSDFVRNQEYTVTATGIKDNADSSAKFTWTVEEGVVVALDETSVDQGDKFGLTVKDKAGKDVKDAKVEVTSFNANILTATTGEVAPNKVEFEAQDLSGTVKVEVKTTLVDGTKLTNTFNVTVKEPVVNIADKGYVFLNGALTDNTVTGTEYKYANSAAFEKYANGATTLVEGTTRNFYAFAETNGNPDEAHIDWSKAKKVSSSNSVVATATLSAKELEVKGNKAGKTTLTVEFEDKSKKSFNIEVTAKPVFTDLDVDTTAINLSDEDKTNSHVEGVNQATVQMRGLDQFKKAFDITGETDGKIVISTNTNEGLELDSTISSAVNNVVTLDENDINGLTDSYKDVFTVKAKEDKPVKNAKVTINYFAKDSDAKPTMTKTITVNVEDVDATVKASSIDVVLTAGSIDANGANVTGNVIESSVKEVYLLNDKGHRIGKIAGADATLESKTPEDKNVKDESNKLVFSDTNAQTYLRDSGEVVVQVSVTDDGNKIKKNETVKYENTAVTPDKAAVKTNAVSIKLDSEHGSITTEQILFGIGDADQLVIDNNAAIAVKKNAKNAGYKYNQPLVTVTGTDGKVMPLGINLYGTTETEFQKDSSLWNNEFINNKVLRSKFATRGFDIDVEVTNIVTTEPSTTVDKTGVKLANKDSSATFTLVVKGIYIEGDTPQDKDNNLLATPVQLNVSVEGTEFDATVINARKTEDDNAVNGFNGEGTTYATKALAEDAILALATNGTIVRSDISWAGAVATVTLNTGSKDFTFTDITEVKVAADNADIATAKNNIESATYTALQVDADSEADALTKAQALVDALALEGTTAKVVAGTFNAAIAGVGPDNPGNDGSYTFTVTIEKGLGTTETSSEQTMTITATPGS